MTIEQFKEDIDKEVAAMAELGMPTPSSINYEEVFESYSSMSVSDIVDLLCMLG